MRAEKNTPIVTFYRAAVVFILSLLVIACSTPSSNTLFRFDTNEPWFESNGIRYVGKRVANEEVEIYLGVPFAQPPIGELRWAPPQKITATNITVMAKRFAHACMQGPHLVDWYRDVIGSFGGDPAQFQPPEISEDCLYLNIWRPSVVPESSTGLPVYVFIHGGSNKGGWSYEPNYVGEELARRGVIVVTIAYRLGVFGFFAHPELQQANFGLLDQIAALQWLRDNIQAVGGDPNKVTVSGESAGANNIEFLLATPAAEGLFQRVIHQSGGSSQLDKLAKQENDKLGIALASHLLGDHASQAGGQLAGLKQQSAQAVQTASEEVYRSHYYDPVIDGYSVAKPLDESIRQNNIHSVDLIIGTNADEWTIYLDENETLESWAQNNLEAESAKAIVKLINSDPLYAGETKAKQLDLLISAYNFVCPSLKLAQSVAGLGGKSWVYYFSKVRPGSLAAKMGAYHGAELPYVFNTHDDWLPTEDDDRLLTEAIIDYWVQFIRHGDPNVDSQKYWPQYSSADSSIQNLNIPLKSEAHVSQKLCDILMP